VDADGLLLLLYTCSQEKEDELWKAMDEELKGIIAFYMRKEAEVLSKLEVRRGCMSQCWE
jgi:hypothetical protein